MQGYKIQYNNIDKVFLKNETANLWVPLRHVKPGQIRPSRHVQGQGQVKLGQARSGQVSVTVSSGQLRSSKARPVKSDQVQKVASVR